jgi:hypothetical protein
VLHIYTNENTEVEKKKSTDSETNYMQRYKIAIFWYIPGPMLQTISTYFQIPDQP